MIQDLLGDSKGPPFIEDDPRPEWANFGFPCGVCGGEAVMVDMHALSLGATSLWCWECNQRCASLTLSDLARIPLPRNRSIVRRLMAMKQDPVTSVTVNDKEDSCLNSSS